jgi:predicted ATPase/signal transduction histidine kinase/tRNA A-37 threonylcarbamoyl transferase component Bud32
MLSLPGYDVAERLHQSSRTLVYRGRREDGVPVVLKTPLSQQPSLGELARIRNEYQVGKDIAHPGIIRILGLEMAGHRPALVMEDFGGQALYEVLGQAPAEPELLLEMATQLVRALEELHGRGITHKDINPANIVYNPDTGQLKLIDLGIASVLSREGAPTADPTLLEGTLPYMSPEQTGRMNRSVDYRTDFYSLGVTLYELATGRLPFDSSDPVELIHAHIARTPEAPSALNPEVPAALSAVVMKLLAKTADERYQSALGLAADLERCRALLAQGAEAVDFSPGERDMVRRFSIPERLYGRRRELDRLDAALERTLEGRRQLLLLAGPSGIGKSSLARELRRPAAARGGRFAHGKFDQLKEGVPHSAFLDAARDLVRQLLTGSDEELHYWRRRLSEYLGADAGVVTRLIPELQAVLGQEPALRRLPVEDAEARFTRLARAFIRAFAGAAHPLVLVFDDLQWADSASLRMLELVLADQELHHLLLVGTYRDDEVEPSRPLSLALRAVAEGPAEVAEIQVGPLEVGHITRLIADATHSTTDAAQPLAELVRRKTLGAPLFVRQLLRTLHDDGLLRYDPAADRWTWDLKEVERRQVEGDVVDLLMRNMEGLPEATRAVLELASCIGGRFDLGTLVMLTGNDAGQVAEALRPAVEQGIVTTVCSGFGRILSASREACESTAQELMQIFLEFHHDRIQQAAQQRIPVQRLRLINLDLGRLLLSNLSEEALEQRLFEVVNHLGMGIPELSDPKERLEVARLHLRAGLKAHNTGARSAAGCYFQAGISLLPPDCWSAHQELAFELHIGLYHSLVMVVSQAQRALELGQELLRRAATPTQRLRAVALHVIQLAIRGRDPGRALELGTEALREHGIEIQPADLDRAIAEGHAELERRLAGREVADLVNLPQMTDALQMALMEVLEHVFYFPVFMGKRDLAPLVALQCIRLSLEHGNGPGSGSSYAMWGFIESYLYGNLRRGHQFGQLAVAVAEGTGFKQSMTRGMAMGTAWPLVPPAESLERARENFRQALDLSETFAPAMTAGAVAWVGFMAGVPLVQLQDEVEPLLELVDHSMSDLDIREIHLTLRAIEALRGKRPRTELFDTAEEARQALEVLAQRNREGWIWYHVLKARLHYLFGQASQAQEYALKARERIDLRIGHYPSHEMAFYQGLILAALCGDAEESQRTRLRQRLQKMLELLEGWVEAGATPVFGPMLQLLRAETARVDGDLQAVAPAFERAISGAQQSGMLQVQALANELAGRYFLGRGLDKVAQVYLADARYCYERWGATAKVEQLEAHFPQLVQEAAPPAPGTRIPSSTQTSTSSHAQVLDMASMLKATQAISSEMVLDSLLEKLLQIALQNTGAERGFLVLPRQGQLVIAAASGTGKSVDLPPESPLTGSDRLSAGIVQYVARTMEPVVLADAARQGSFQTDPYVSRRKLRSVLCAPMLNQGQLVGVIYLENNLTTDAFTPQRLEVVDLLTSQAAISIVNARLYGELERTNRQMAEYSRTLEQRVEERTRDLAQKNAQLNESLQRQQQMQNQLVISEKMASLGNLVAGVAHEINTPVGAVASSADTARRVAQRIEQALDEAEALQDLQGNPRLKRLLGMLDDSHEVINTASERVTGIVQTLRNFARLDEAERKQVDLHEGLDSTLILVRHRLKDSISVTRDYGQLQPVTCYPNQLNQVFMNLIINAVDAIEQAATRNPDRDRPRAITIRTRMENGQAVVQITDTGDGVPAELQNRIFDPGYTTKGVGIGTGLGLSISFSIIQKHQGTLTLQSDPGQGATFTVSIPVN